MSDHFLSHSNSFGFEMGKDAAGCRAFNRNFIVGGVYMKNCIAEKRKARGLTQQQLASLLGVTRQTIISLENDRYNPSILLAHKIAQIFDARIEDIFIFEEEDA